ncbi:MAG: DUF3810 family protein [Deinococcales bacterium]
MLNFLSQTTLQKFARVVVWCLAGIALLWQLPIPPDTIEHSYSRNIFPVVAFVVIHLTDWLPFSLMGTVLIALFVGVIVLFTRVKSFWQKKPPLIPILGHIVLGALAIYGAFLLLWGANYRRLGTETLLKLEPNKVQAANLENIAKKLLKTIQTTQNAAREFHPALESIRHAIRQQIKSVTGVTPTLPSRVKVTPAGVLFVLNTSGVVSPFTLEAHVDGALPEPFLLAVSAHELVHTSGFAGEADTDLLAALAGLKAENPYARYGVALWYFARVLGNLPEDMQKALAKELPQGARADYQAMRQAQRRYSLPLLAEIAQFFYGGYLRSQGVHAGVADYSRIGRLLAAADIAMLTNP